MNPRGGTILLACLTLLPLGCGERPPTHVPARRAGDRPDFAEGPSEAHNGFAVDLYSKLREREGNLFFSPTGIASALAAISAGAGGETAGQIGKVLRQPGATALSPDYLAYLRGLNRAEAPPAGPRLAPPSNLRLANSLWCQSGLAILPGFRSTLGSSLEAEIFPVDFKGAPEEAARRVAAWVADRTSGKIRGSVRREDITPDTNLLIATAVHFRNNWDQRFASEMTKPADFLASARRKISVPMMHGTFKRARYLDSGRYQALELAYADRRFAMVAILPRAENDLAGLEASLTPYFLKGMIARLGPRDEVVVALPKFAIRAELSLDGALKALGMPLAFGPSADFSGIAGSKADLRLARVVHAADLAVDEEGTEAAAFTGALFKKAERAEAAPPPVFRADHPFLFLIRDLKTGAILFLGRLVDPGQSAPEAEKGD